MVAKQEEPPWTVNPMVNGVATPGPVEQESRGSNMTDIATKLLDLRGVGRFPEFNGKDTEWQDWKFKFQVCADMVGLGEFPTQEQHPSNLERARLLYGIRVQVRSGRAMGIPRTVQESNGLEAWRRLHVEFPFRRAQHAPRRCLARCSRRCGAPHSRSLSNS